MDIRASKLLLSKTSVLFKLVFTDLLIAYVWNFFFSLSRIFLQDCKLCVGCFSSDVCIAPFTTCWTNSLEAKSCMFVTEVSLFCVLLPPQCLHCSSVRVNSCGSWVKGECITLVCRQICCPLYKVLEFCERACVEVTVHDVFQQESSDLPLAVFPLRIISTKWLQQ